MIRRIASLAVGGALIGFEAYAAKAAEACQNECNNADYLLVLGYSVHGSEPDDILKMRISDAAEYMINNQKTKAVCCGGIVHPDQLVSEAAIIKNGLIEAGIPEERIILEDKSKTTFENFINAKTIIEKQGKENPVIAFITSDFHVLRASVICKDAGLDATGLPASTPEGMYYKNLLREIAVFPMMYVEKLKNRKK